MASVSPRARIKSAAVRVVRGVLLRYVRAQPGAEEHADADRRVFILLWVAYGMGGTIRAAFNLAEYLTERGYEVEVISGVRERDTPFFGAFPAGVPVTSLDDRREGAGPRGVAGLLQRVLRSRASLFMPIDDRASRTFSLWTDIQLVRRLRGRSGFLLGTRPGINFMIARLRAPGLKTIGLEQMNLAKHARPLRRAMQRFYPSLDALVVLTDADVENYRVHLDGKVPPLRRIPNTVRRLPGAQADPGGQFSTRGGGSVFTRRRQRLTSSPEFRFAAARSVVGFVCFRASRSKVARDRRPSHPASPTRGARGDQSEHRGRRAEGRHPRARAADRAASRAARRRTGPRRRSRVIEAASRHEPSRRRAVT